MKLKDTYLGEKSLWSGKAEQDGCKLSEMGPFQHQWYWRSKVIVMIEKVSRGTYQERGELSEKRIGIKKEPVVLATIMAAESSNSISSFS